MRLLIKYTIRFAIANDIESIVSLCAEHAAYEKINYDITNKKEALHKHFFCSEGTVIRFVIKKFV